MERKVKRCIFKVLMKIIVFSVIVVISQIILKTPLITNQVALGQMSNSNDAFVFMEMAKQIRPVVNFIVFLFAACFGYGIFKDIHKVIKSTKEEKE